MDKLSQAIIAMEVHFADKEPRLRAQWETISTVLAEGQNPSTNSERDDICPLCKKKCIPSKYYCADCNNEFIP